MSKKKNASPHTTKKRLPKRTAKKALPLQPAEVSRRQLVTLFQEQRRMHNRVARDRAHRYSEFLAKIPNPTEPLGIEASLRAMAPGPAKQPLRILAEGDSWFDYPLPLLRGDGVIYQLQKMLGYPVANMAHYGLEVDQMMGLQLRQEIIARLSDPNVRFDALLFSGGGNDLVGDKFCIWLKDSPPVVPPTQMLDDNAVSAAMAILAAEYRELADIRDQTSPETTIFVHGYDFPLVTGQGVCGAGPWLKPSLDYAYKKLGVTNPDPNDEYLVVKTFLQRFNTMLNEVAASIRKFVLVPTQGTLNADSSDWQNEIHPSSKGFVKIAQKFTDSLSSVFP